MKKLGPEDHASRGLGPVMRARAQAVIDHPEGWQLNVGVLIWVNRPGDRVTDQAVTAVRRGEA